MRSTKPIAIVIVIFIIFVMVNYDIYFNKKGTFRPMRPKVRNNFSTAVVRKDNESYHNFTKDRVLELQRVIDEMRKHYKVNKHAENRSLEQRNHSANIRKVVLVYTKFFGGPFPWVKNSFDFNHWEGIKCPYYSCELTFNRKDIARSNAVIFHSRDMPANIDKLNAMKGKYPNQRWVYFTLESPLNNPSRAPLANMFNWTMSFRNKSDIFLPYSYSFESSSLAMKPARTYLKGKDRLVFWAASHCGLLRDKYVKELLTYINVDVFGACRSSIGAKSDAGDCPRKSQTCEKKLQRYKFKLAFENCYCVDYITEKYWHGIEKGIVPVVLGGALYGERTAIPGSFINVRDFKSVKELADFLVFLDKNDEEYVKYFAWKSKYRVTDDPPWNCQLCARLNLDSGHTFYEKLDSPKEGCGIGVEEVQKILAHQSNKTDSMHGNNIRNHR